VGEEGGGGREGKGFWEGEEGDPGMKGIDVHK